MIPRYHCDRARSASLATAWPVRRRRPQQLAADLLNGPGQVVVRGMEIALHLAYYNFVWIPRTLRMTPAMGTSVTDHLWEVADLIL